MNWIKVDQLILCGNMNFMMGRGEIWGISSRQDHLAFFPADKFESLGLVDIEPLGLKPMWVKNKA
jgi:hypothetical protein